MPIAAKPYGPDSTPEEINELRARVTRHATGILLYEEVPVVTEFQIGVCFGHVEELLLENPGAGLIIDIRTSERPSAAIRECLRGWYCRLDGKLSRIAVVTGKNFLINIVAKFIMGGIPQKVTVHTTVSDAVEALRHVG